MARSWAQSYSWQSALELLSHQNAAMGLKDICALHHSTIRVCAEQGQWKWAAYVLDLMRKHDKTSLLPSYKVAIKACGKVGEWRMTLRLLDQMKVDNIHPAPVMTEVIICLGRNPEQWRKALYLYQKMVKNRISPSSITTNSLLNAFAQNGLWKRALALLQEMKPTRQDVISYTTCITACVNGGADWTVAAQLFRTMLKQEITPNIQSYNCVLRACANQTNSPQRSYRQAMEYFKDLSG